MNHVCRPAARGVTACAVICFLCAMVSGSSAWAAEQSLAEVVYLSPGDSRSIEFEMDDTLVSAEGWYAVFIVATIADGEIHRLMVNVSPVGDVGSEILYFTGGAMLSFAGNALFSVELFEPQFTSGFNHITYYADVNPVVSLGMLLCTITTEFAHFEFPLDMTMTLTLER